MRKRLLLPVAFVGLIALSNVVSNTEGDPVVSAEAEAEAEAKATTTSTTVERETATTTTRPTTTARPSQVDPPISAAITVTDQELADARGQLVSAAVLDAFADSPTYERVAYTGGGWPDSDGDCQSDRHEILIEESLIEPTLDADGCRVESGLWVDAYDGTEYTLADQVTIDHVIPLAAAHRAGAWEWDEQSKRAFASDIEFAATHVGVGGDVNQAKGDRGPEDWRPPNGEAWCRYAVDWISVKDRWSLAFTTAEVRALDDMLATCQPVTAINALGAVPAPAEVSPTTSSSTTTTPTTTTAPVTTSTTTASPTTTQALAPVVNCQGYDPCLEPGPDVDCAGGSGNGPRYVGRVIVTGSDPYDLDRDGDGIGCES